MADTSFDAAAAVAALSSIDNNVNDPAAPTSFAFDIYDDNAARPPTNVAQLVPPQQQKQLQLQQEQPQPPQQQSTPLPQSSPRLPDGPCNFVDLSHGSSGAQCGCRRFWSRSNNSIAATPMTPSFGAGALVPANAFFNGSLSGLDASQTGWCMCSHHACFHDHTANGGSSLDRASITTSFFTTSAAPAAAALETSEKTLAPHLLLPSSSTSFQENEEPQPQRQPQREPLSAIQDMEQDGSRQEEDRDSSQHFPDISFGFPSGVPAQLNSSFVAMIAEAERESRDLTMAAAEAEAVEDEVATEDEAPEASQTPADIPPSPPAQPAPTSVATSVAGPPADYSIPDTLSWGPYAMSVRGDAAAIAAESIPTSNPNAALLPPSQNPPPSTTTTTSYTSQVRYMRPFAGKGLQTLAQNAPGQSSSGSPLRQLLEQQAATSASRPLGPESLTNAVQSHEARLNKLENPSFSGATSLVSQSFTATQAHEECLERHDQMDLRVTELESRFGEFERYHVNNDNDAATVTASSIVSVSASGAPLSTTASINSRTSRPTLVTDPAILSQLQALQEHVSLLQQQALPSPSRPWQLEVVFLPFPLKGVWVEAVHFGATDAVAAAAAAQRRQAGATPSNNSNANGDDEWTQRARRADTPRLLPRACIPGRNIDRRLRSRGFVQTLTVRGADARSLQMAMATAFGPVLQMMAANDSVEARPERRSSASASSQFLALQQPWVPLRKVHKDSRLRFLTRSEMLTPAIWDASFMIASVVMKASGGLHRLYVTQPGAYLQDRHSYAHGWSWQQLREMPQVQVDLGDNDFGIDDACWAWDSKLDQPPTASTSGSSSVSSSPVMTSSRLGRPSPTPFSRGTTPLSRARGHTPHRASYPSMVAPMAAPVPVAVPGRSHSVSIGGTSGSSEQFFTVAQSPIQQRLQQQQHLHQMASSSGNPGAPTTLRRSLSPFMSSSMASGARRVPPPIRTTSVPVPHQAASPVMMRGASVSSRRRIHSAGSNHAGASASVAPPVSAGGVNKRSRRRSTRSPSFGEFWPRNTPRYSRSPSVTPGPGPSAMWAVPADEQQQLQQEARQHRHQHQPAPQRVRGTTPFAYATPYSTAAGADHPPTSASSIASGSGRRKRQRQHRDDNEQRYLRNSRHGSRGPMPSVMGLGNGAQQYYDDDDMIMAAYDSDDVDDFDFPMTQEGDEDDDDDDDGEDDIEVYEDEQDMLGLGDYATRSFDDDCDHMYLQEQGRPPHGQLLPKDQPRPGIESDGENNFNDDDEDEDDDEDYIGHTFGGQRQRLTGTQDSQISHDDEDESMPDSENMNPLSLSLFEDNIAEDGGQQQQQELQQGEHQSQLSQQPQDQQRQTEQPQEEDHHSDVSSQPSEYPSTRRPWRLMSTASGPGPAAYKTNVHPQHQHLHLQNNDIKADHDGDTGMGFKIHEDGDAVNL